MKIFLDTSSLFKLYHREEGTSELEQVFSKAKVTTVFLSEISKIEFSSTIWKKVRTKEIAELDAQKTLSLFESDFGKYAFITIDSLLIEQANILISKYGKKGLRTLDSIQLSTAVSLFQKADIFFTADHQLQSFFLAEGLSIE
jgi:predicted nucleic acid-binding protein